MQGRVLNQSLLVVSRGYLICSFHFKATSVHAFPGARDAPKAIWAGTACRIASSPLVIIYGWGTGPCVTVLKSSSGGTGFQPVRSYMAGRDARPTDFSCFVGGPAAHGHCSGKLSVCHTFFPLGGPQIPLNPSSVRLGNACARFCPPHAPALSPRIRVQRESGGSVAGFEPEP